MRITFKRQNGAPLCALFLTLGLLIPVQGFTASDTLKSSLQTQEGIEKAARSSQQKIDSYADEASRMLDEYQQITRETETLKIYNNHLEKLVKAQREELDSIDRQFTEIEDTNRGIVPLMLKMVDTLEEFVELDVPFLTDERTERIAALRELMERADVTVAEMYRRVTEAYQVETEYGRTIEAYRGTLDSNGTQRSVDFLRIGRVALMYQTLDTKESGVWNQQSQSWDVLPDSYRKTVLQGLRIARKQAAPDLLRIPVSAPEVVQ